MVRAAGPAKPAARSSARSDYREDKEEVMVANTNLPKKLPTAQEVMEKLALAEAEKASVETRKHAAAEAEKKALTDKLTKPSGVSDEEALKRVATIVDRAVANGLTEVQV